MRLFLLIIFILGVIYLVLPGPAKIEDIPALPDSVKSVEPGDTTQVSNIAAYFSDFRRKYVIDFYKDVFQKAHPFYFFPPLRFNRPPEDAFVYIRDQQASTYLEELSYPLRDSLFINGFEPFNEKGKAYRRGATSILINGIYYDSKTTLRYYNSNVFGRILVFSGIMVSAYLLYVLFKKALREKDV